VCGAIGAGLAIVLPTVISALTIFYSLMTAALLLPLIAGLYTSRVGANQAIASMLVSIAVTFALEALTGGKGALGVPSTLVGVAAGGVVMIFMRRRHDRASSDHG